MRNDETTIKGNLATVIVRNDHGPDLAYSRGQLYLELEGPNLTGLDADELRDAIDKAVGPRKEADLQEGSKPYRPVDRDRLLRHIEDIEATLKRRNKRHEEDQERIRELERIAMRRGDRIDELEAKAKVAALSPEEQIEALEKMPPGCEAVLDPPRLLDTPSAKARCIPAILVERITSHADGMGGLDLLLHDSDGLSWYGLTQQVLELGLTAEDFGTSAEIRRKEYEDKGLADWEIELLMGESA